MGWLRLALVLIPLGWPHIPGRLVRCGSGTTRSAR
jgi:hypothetical protein